MQKNIQTHSMHPLLSAGGLNLLPNFQKGRGELDRIWVFRGDFYERGGDLFQGACRFYVKRLKFGICNLNWEVLTENLVTVKRLDNVKDENLRLWGSLKIRFLGGQGVTKQICDLLQEKGPSTFAFLTAFRCFQLNLAAFQKFDTKISY